MTISQSRWGLQAEMGRKPSSKPEKNSKTWMGVPAGVGVASGGVLAERLGRAHRLEADQVWRQSQAQLGAAQAAFDPSGRARANGKWTAVGPAKRTLREASRNAAAADALRHRAARTATRAKVGGRLALVGGTALAGLAAIKAERERGTLGWKRTAPVKKSLADIKRGL